MPTALGLLLAASLAIASCGGSDEGARAARHARPRPAPQGHAATAVPPEAAIIGDSYTAGANASSPRRGYAERVARTLGWDHADIRGLPGAGYVKPSVSGRRLRGVVRRVVKRHPPVVVVVMGHNDTRVNPVREERSARRTLAILHRRLPFSRIVVIGPIWQSGSPEPRVLATRDAILAAVRRVGGLLWIDPIAEHWFTGDKRLHTGNASHFISSDDNHPNNAGHAHIARLLLRDLKRLGVAGVAHATSSP